VITFATPKQRLRDFKTKLEDSFKNKRSSLKILGKEETA
jgi:hypothetical protein